MPGVMYYSSVIVYYTISIILCVFPHFQSLPYYLELNNSIRNIICPDTHITVFPQYPLDIA